MIHADPIAEIEGRADGIDETIQEVLDMFEEYGTDPRDLMPAFDSIIADTKVVRQHLCSLAETIAALEQQVTELRAENSKLISDAGWTADYHRQQLDARREDEWK